MIKKAMFFEVWADPEVQCRLCAHAGRIKDGRRGVCGVREDRERTLHRLD
jgi:pyruvate formate lyase activating enzyme